MAVLLGTAMPGFAGEFHIQMTALPGVADGAADFDSVLAAARLHRRLSPDDTIVIDLAPGIHLRKPIVLTDANSGAPSAPLILRGAGANGTTISGGVALQSHRLTNVSTGPVSLMPSDMRDRIRVASLGDAGQQLSPPLMRRGTFASGNAGPLALFLGNKRLKPSQWPSEGYQHRPSLKLDAEKKIAELQISSDAPETITQEPNLWIAGYWAWNWWYEITPVTAIDRDEIYFAAPASGIKASARYFFVNVASTLSNPNTYYYDNNTNSIFYVANDGDASGTEEPSVTVAVGLLRVTHAAYIQIENVAFEKTSGTTVLLQDDKQVVLRDCFVGHSGGTVLLSTAGLTMLSNAARLRMLVRLASPSPEAIEKRLLPDIR